MSNTHIAGLAWYGAILSTLGAIKIVRDVYNDRGHVKIEWQFDMREAGDTRDLFLIRVINRGRRPIKITHVATKMYGQREIGLLGHSFTNSELRVLTDERPSTEYTTYQDGISPEKLWYVQVSDARGKEYRKYNPASTPLKYRLYYRITKPKSNANISLPH